MDLFSSLKLKTNFTVGIKVGFGLLFFWTALGVYHTSLNSVLLSLEGIHTDWFYLSLNYFSRTLVWILLTPLIYGLYAHLLKSSKKIYFIILSSLLIGVLISVLHVTLSIRLDVFLRSSLKIIDTNFWDIITTEVPFVVKSLYRSYITFVFLLAVFISNDHFGVIKRFVVNKPQVKSIKEASFNSEMPIVEITKPISLSKTKSSNSLSEKLVVKTEGKTRFLQLDQILYIESKGNYVLIKFSDERVVVRMTLKELKSQLPHINFFRISRSVIINQDYIRELEPWLNGEYFVWMIQGEKFKTGRSYKKQIHLLLNLKTQE